MLIKESEYIREILGNLPIDKKTKILNVGSQDSNYVKLSSHIKKNVFDTIKSYEAKLINFDLYPSPGVDIFGDIYNDEVLEKLKVINPDIILLNVSIQPTTS